MVGEGVPTAAEAAAEGRSSARGFPARRRAKLGLDSCRRMRGNYWSSRIGRRRVGDRGSTADRSLPAEGKRRSGSSGGGLATENGSGASVE
jgi:hypothetical protein